MNGLLADWSFLLLCGMVTAALFFLMVGLRELRSLRLEGFLYLMLAIFFGSCHLYYLFNLPIDAPSAFWLSKISFWDWCVQIFAPALIVLFLLLGIVNFGFSRFKAGLIKIFFGLTLVCYLFMVGIAWPTDVKGVMAVVWSFIWFDVELGSID